MGDSPPEKSNDAEESGGTMLTAKVFLRNTAAGRPLHYIYHDAEMLACGALTSKSTSEESNHDGEYYQVEKLLACDRRNNKKYYRVKMDRL